MPPPSSGGPFEPGAIRPGSLVPSPGQPELFVHVSPVHKGAWLLARVVGDEIQLLQGMGADSPRAENSEAPFGQVALSEAIEWLRFMLDGVMMSSVCEWWDVDDDLPDDVARAFGLNGPRLRAFIEGQWRLCDAAAPGRWEPPC